MDNLQAMATVHAMYVVLSAAVFFLGACIGSFLNVCIFRIPRELSIVHPRSSCPTCGHMIAWHDNVPMLSFIMLRGSCRHCGSPISPRYWIVELLTGTLFLLAWMKLRLVAGETPLGMETVYDWPLVPIYWVVISLFILGTFVDFEHLIIPDRVTLGGVVIGLILSPLVPSLHGETHWFAALKWSAIGAAVGGGSLWLVAIVGRWIFKKEAMGFGDVKLLAAIGALFGSKAVFFTILASSLAGSIVGIALVATGRSNMQSRIPFGPYIVLAALVWLYWGARFWTWYTDLIMPQL
jgi:leader peptidase (prepilin peptidase)/N-methyltransferase